MWFFFIEFLKSSFKYMKKIFIFEYDNKWKNKNIKVCKIIQFNNPTIFLSIKVYFKLTNCNISIIL